MGEFSSRFHNEIKKINKVRTLSLLAFVATLLTLQYFAPQTNFKNNVAQAAQAPDPGTVGFMIYGQAYVGDTFAPGWTAKTWYGGGNTVDLTNITPVYDGTHSISYQATAPSDTLELYTTTPIDIAQYKYLNLFARGGMNGLRFQVTLLGPPQANGNHQPIGTPLTFEGYGGIPPTDRWFVYGFPIDRFAAGTTRIYGIGIMDLNGGGSQFPVYLDEIAFSQARATETTPTPMVGLPGTATPIPTPIPPYYPNISPWVFIVPALIIFLAIFFE